MNAKKLSKRIIASVITLMLALSCFVLPSVFVSAEDDETTTVKIHYLREDKSYGEWDVWAWPEGSGGAGYAFTDNGDEKGAVATIEIKESAPSVGFIVRKPDWSAKDPDPDRFVDISKVVSGTVDVYCKSGVEAFDVDYSNAVIGLKLKSAVADEDKVTVKAVFAIDPGDEVITKENFIIEAADGSKIPVDNVVTNGTQATLTLSRKLNFKNSYTVSYKVGYVKLQTPEYFSTKEFEDMYTYLGDDLGANYSKGSTFFRVWAPTAKKVSLNLYENGTDGEAYSVVDMARDVKGTWIATVSGDLNGVYYTYTADFGLFANKDIVDPYARTVGVNGKRGMVINLYSTDPDGWTNDSRHTYANLTDMVIYEVHIRDFSSDPDSGITNTGKYIAFTENGTHTASGVATGIDHLKDLGITTVHILPSYDYGSVDETKLDKPQYNWGYDPVNYNSPEGSYSTDPYHGEVRVNEYKQMVKALHDAGIGVVMDVVYNHTYNTDYCFNRLVPGYFYRPGQNTSGCGNDVASERSMVSKFIVDSVKYWADEYHLDGFRFDLMGILDVDTMNGVRMALDTINDDIIVYGEGWDMSSVPTKDVKMANFKNAALTPGIAYFSDTIRDGIRGHVFTDDEPGYIGGGTKANAETAKVKVGIRNTNTWCPGPEQIINYQSCHDNHTVWDRLNNTSPDPVDESEKKAGDPRVFYTEAQRIAANKLGAVIVFTSQGIPFMMSGEEFLRTKLNDDGTTEHNSYASPDSVNLLDYSRIDDYKDVYDYYKGLIQMRAKFGELRLTDNDIVQSDVEFADTLSINKRVIAYSIKGNLLANASAGETKHDMFVVLNPLFDDITVDLPEGTWSVVANGEKAGTEVLATAEGSIDVPSLTAAVLVKDYDGSDYTEDVLTDSETGITASGNLSGLNIVTSDLDSGDGSVAKYSVKIVDENGNPSDFEGSAEIRIPFESGYDLFYEDGTDARADYDSENGVYVFNTTSNDMIVKFMDRPELVPAPGYTPVKVMELTDGAVTVKGLFEDNGIVLKVTDAVVENKDAESAFAVSLVDEDGNPAVIDTYTDYQISYKFADTKDFTLSFFKVSGEEMTAEYADGAYTFVTDDPIATYYIIATKTSQESSESSQFIESSVTTDESTATDTSKTITPDDKNVPTGDSSSMAIILVAILISGAAAAIVMASKKSKKAE